MTTATPSRCYSRHQKAAQEEGDQGTYGSGVKNVESRL